MRVLISIIALVLAFFLFTAVLFGMWYVWVFFFDPATAKRWRQEHEKKKSAKSPYAAYFLWEYFSGDGK